MAATCAKPTCSLPAVAWFTASPADRSVVIHDHPADAAIALCQSHRDRFTVPVGWTLGLDGGPTGPDRSDDRRPWFAAGVDEEPATVPTPPGSLLSRAFNGPTGHPAVITPDELEARRFARLERVESEVDGAPEGLGDRMEEHGDDDGETDGDGDQRADGDLGSGEDRSRDHDDEHEPERDDRAEPDGSDELPFPPLESEATARAAIG